MRGGEDVIDHKTERQNVESALTPKVSRRTAVKTIAGGISTIAAYHVLPVKWSTPIIEQIFLPAHAQTSGDFTDIHPVVHEHTHISTDPHTQEVIDPKSNAVVYVHSHPHTHEKGDPDYHTDLGNPDSNHSHTHSHSDPHPSSCTQCGQQLLTDGIGGQPKWNSLLVPYNSNENSYLFSDAASFMTQLVSLSDTCIGSTLRLELGDGGGTGPLRVRIGVGNTVRETTYSGGGLIFEMVVPVGPTSPTVVDIRQASPPFDNTTKIIGPKLTVIC